MRPIIITLFTFFTILCSAQKIEKNEKDNFTGDQVIETSWEKFTTKGMYSYVRVKKINSTHYLQLKFMPNVGVFAVNEGEVLYLNFKDGEIVKLTNPEYEISKRGGGSTGIAGSATQGMKLSFVLSNDLIETISNKTIEKIRLYTTDGYVEGSVKKKHFDNIKDVLELFDNLK